MACPNYQRDIERLKDQHPQAWKDAHTGNAHTEDFVRLVAAHLHALDPHVALNGKRGNPHDISDDALNILDPIDGPGRTPTGQRCWVVDFIANAGASNASVYWNPQTDPVGSSGANVKPGAAPPVPGQPPPPVVKPYPGDAVWDAVGAELFEDYAKAGQGPNPQMGRWFGRTIWDATEGDESGTVLTVEASITKHRKEWRAALGLPPPAIHR